MFTFSVLISRSASLTPFSGLRFGVGVNHLQFCPAEGFDAAGRIDLSDRHVTGVLTLLPDCRRRSGERLDIAIFTTLSAAMVWTTKPGMISNARAVNSPITFLFFMNSLLFQ